MEIIDDEYLDSLYVQAIDSETGISLVGIMLGRYQGDDYLIARGVIPSENELSYPNNQVFQDESGNKYEGSWWFYDHATNDIGMKGLDLKMFEIEGLTEMFGMTHLKVIE